MAFSDWSTNPANNGVISGVTYWPEGMLPAQVNDSARQMMADLAVWLAAPAFPNGLPGYQQQLNFTPVQQGTGVGQLANVVKIGWDGVNVRMTVDTTDQGGIVTTTKLGAAGYNINGAFMRRNGNDLFGADNFVAGTNYQAALAYTPANKAGDTFTGPIKRDTNFALDLLSGVDPIITLDANSYLTYNRTTKKLIFAVNGTGVFSVDSTGTIRVLGTILQNQSGV